MFTIATLFVIVPAIAITLGTVKLALVIKRAVFN
tara:strand:+ start:1316 stop:1417 length:102 start_codon:yes stop_codon:yes gene_type:complete